jgi:formate C-acetyltransferase
MANAAEKSPIGLKQPHGLSPRIQWLRDYYFRGVPRAWNNEWSCWSTGAPWDVCYDELHFYIVPENYAMFDALTASMLMASRDVPLPSDFWSRSLVERRAWFIREVVVNQLPQEILPGDLIAGARFNLMASRCYDGKEARRRAKKLAGVRSSVKWFHEHGYGNAGATSGHLIPDFARVLKDGFRGIHAELQEHYGRLASEEQTGDPGRQLRAMMSAAEMPRELASRYAGLCRRLAAEERDAERVAELEQMARNLERVPWEPARTFWEAIQSLWLTHMLIMSDECYPGPGDSFGRVDQYLLPYWRTSVGEGMDPEFGKEILKCLWVQAFN